MKELTIEEKAKRYDEALQKTRRWYDSNTNEGYRGIFEDIFPELKESEDERVRNFLIKQANSVLDSITDDDEEVPAWKSALAWLEKQGEHANFRNKIQIGDKVTRNKDGLLVNLSQLNRVAKPADNVESKFKVGDWITNSKCTWKIDSIDEDMYYNNHCGIDCGGDIKSIDEEYHLWTIKDARDGDILSDRYSIVIFRGIGNEKWKDVIDYHIGLFTNSQHLEVQKGLSHWGRINEVTLHPAIKEQRDTLMKAMADSGYEWDAEKKELKKIEQTPNDEIGNYDHGKVLDALMSAKKTPEPAWSEEGKGILFRTIDNLKFLKDTISTDPKYYVNIIDIEREITWLKSLRPQNTWKPSDEQMDALDDGIAICSERDYETECRLDNLRQDLKKLREE